MTVASSPQKAARTTTAIIWATRLLGCVALCVGGVWAVDVSQVDGGRPAVNPTSVGMYAAMIVLYGTVAWTVRAWRQPEESTQQRTSTAALEALLVGVIGAPIVVAAAATYSCFALDGCT